MTIVTLSARGAIPVHEAWDRYVDISRWPEWSPQISTVEATSARLAFGVTGRVHAVVPGVSIDFTVEAVDEDARTWAWTVRRWPVTMRLEHSVVARGAGSMTSLRTDGPLPAVLAYAPLAQLALHRLVTKPVPPHRDPRPEVLRAGA